MKHITFIGILMVASILRSEAEVRYTFTESPAGVQLDYSGSINTSALSFQGGLTASGSYIDMLGRIVPGQQIYDLENFQPSPLLPQFSGVSDRYCANNISFSWGLTTSLQRYLPSSAYGDTFGFYIFGSPGDYTTWMNLPYQYHSGSSINGGMLFQGQTFASMGLDSTESFQVFLPGNDVISGVVKVPEPQSAALFVFAAVVAFFGLRRDQQKAERSSGRADYASLPACASGRRATEQTGMK